MQAGRDALAKAPTGSGKTLAYLAAIIHDLQAQEPHLSRAEGTYAIIMAPTRELCIQICDVLTLILRRFIWLVNTAQLPSMVHISLELHVGFCSTQLPFKPLLQLVTWHCMLWLKSLSKTCQSCSTGWPAFQETTCIHRISHDLAV